MAFQIVIENQTIPVVDEIGKSDEMVKMALQPIFPEVANASITRTTNGDMTTITIIKRAGSKGGLQELIAAQGGRNPVIALNGRLANVRPETLPVEEAIALADEIDAVIEAGKKQFDQVEYATKRLQAARPVAASVVPQGF